MSVTVSSGDSDRPADQTLRSAKKPTAEFGAQLRLELSIIYKLRYKLTTSRQSRPTALGPTSISKTLPSGFLTKTNILKVQIWSLLHKMCLAVTACTQRVTAPAMQCELHRSLSSHRTPLDKVNFYKPQRARTTSVIFLCGGTAERSRTKPDMWQICLRE